MVVKSLDGLGWFESPLRVLVFSCETLLVMDSGERKRPSVVPAKSLCPLKANALIVKFIAPEKGELKPLFIPVHEVPLFIVRYTPPVPSKTLVLFTTNSTRGGAEGKGRTLELFEVPE